MLTSGKVTTSLNKVIKADSTETKPTVWELTNKGTPTCQQK
jgi:hypothetical protein